MHKFNDDVGVQHTGDLSVVGEFLSGVLFEYNHRDEFVLPTLGGSVVVKRGEWLMKRPDGTFYSKPDPLAVVEPIKKKSKGKKKK